MATRNLSRRQILHRGAGVAGGAAALSALGSAAEAAVRSGDTAALAGSQLTGAAATGGGDCYGRIGVRPLINARGTFTVLSGSLLLPEVRRAIDQAARHYVQLDELTEAVGKRLGELTGASFGMVSSGCAAALTHATSACIAGGNPDLHIRLPDLRKFEKTRVVIPSHSRNVYEAAVSATGVEVVEVATVAELEAALGPKTALVYVMAGPKVDNSELDTATLARAAKKREVPVLVDAAAEILTIPNVHLERGADLVAYSGGKALRGPQSAGILLGRKDLVRAAWVHSAPHHGFARGLKVGKEEAMAMLAAVETWVRRDHKAEYTQWTSWLKSIARAARRVDGVRTRIVQPEGLSNRTPSLEVRWDEERLGVSGGTVVDTLYEAEPRIALNEADVDDEGRTGVSITPYMLQPGEHEIVARELVALLRDPPQRPEPPEPPRVDVTGEWQVTIDFAAGTSTAHTLQLAQHGAEVSGTHRGEFVSREAEGSVSGDTLSVKSFYGEEHGDSLSYTFTGKVSGDTAKGALDLDEYLKATWSARRSG